MASVFSDNLSSLALARQYRDERSRGPGALRKEQTTCRTATPTHVLSREREVDIVPKRRIAAGFVVFFVSVKDSPLALECSASRGERQTTRMLPLRWLAKTAKRAKNLLRRAASVSFTSVRALQRKGRCSARSTGRVAPSIS
jgi:hypothetical protein